MTDSDKIISHTPAETAAVETPTQTPKPVSRTSGKWCGSLGALFTILAWVLLVFSSMGSIACGFVGLVLSCFAIKGTTRGWRDLATTCIIASSVLLLVFAIFFFGIRIAVNTL